MAEDPATQSSKSGTEADSGLPEVGGGVRSSKSGPLTAERDTTARSSEPSDVARPGVALSANVNFWSTIASALFSLIALALSLITFFQVNSKPEISMAMPNKIAAWTDLRAGQPQLRIVMKPTFNVDKKTDVAAAVTDATLRIEPPVDANQPPITLPWSDLVEIRDDTYEKYKTFIRIWRGNPEPFLVTQDAREERSMEFAIYAPSSRLHIVAGRWNASLTVQRRDQDPLTRDFCINISDSLAQKLNNGIEKEDGWSGLWFLTDPTPNPLQADAQESGNECYGG